MTHKTEIEYKQTFVKSLKARITASKPRFIQKVCGYSQILKDGFKPHFLSFMSVFIPKLTPDYITPCVMLHLSNGSGSVLIRAKNPIELANQLEKIILYLRSNKVLDNFDYMNELSDKLKLGSNIIIDEKFLDKTQWERIILK